MTVRVLTPAREEFSEAAAFYESEASGLGIYSTASASSPISTNAGTTLKMFGHRWKIVER